MNRWICADCPKPCHLEMADNDIPEVCIVIGDEVHEDKAHFCNWARVVPRKGRKVKE